MCVNNNFLQAYASLPLSQGESLTYVRDQLGHGNIGTTVDTYGHLVPGANRDAVNWLDDPQKSATNLQPGVLAHKKST